MSEALPLANVMSCYLFLIFKPVFGHGLSHKPDGRYVQNFCTDQQCARILLLCLRTRMPATTPREGNIFFVDPSGMFCVRSIGKQGQLRLHPSIDGCSNIFASFIELACGETHFFSCPDVQTKMRERLREPRGHHINVLNCNS